MEVGLKGNGFGFGFGFGLGERVRGKAEQSGFHWWTMVVKGKRGCECLCVLLGLSFTFEYMGFDFCHYLSDVAFSSFFVLLVIHMSFSLLGFRCCLIPCHKHGVKIGLKLMHLRLVKNLLSC